MSIFYANIENEVNDNNNYRKVVFTSNNLQIVYMSLKYLEDIPLETHINHDQFIKIEKGVGKAILNNKEYLLEEGYGLIIPAGTSHRIINTGKNNLKLYTIYSPPEHNKDRIDICKPNDNYKTKYLKYKNKYINLKNQTNLIEKGKDDELKR